MSCLVHFSSISSLIIICLFLFSNFKCSSCDFLYFQEAYLQNRIDKVQVRHEVVFACHNSNNRTIKFREKDPFDKHKLNSSQPLYFFIHGWKNTGRTGWMTELVDYWKRNTNSTLCVVDWGKLSWRDYVSASLNIYDIAKTVASVIESLETSGFDRRNISVVGYSLGAHIAGYTGSLLNGQLGEIIGLDPAGPLLTMPAVVSAKYRLDETDARFVQVIHTSGGTLGTHLKCGHSDFYPNGGMSPQASCVLPWPFRRRSAIKCSHSSAVAFFKQSMDERSELIGYDCSSYKYFEIGLCAENKQGRFGIHSDRVLGNFYFTSSTVFAQLQKPKLISMKKVIRDVLKRIKLKS